jgi:hypothetical protein
MTALDVMRNGCGDVVDEGIKDQARRWRGRQIRAIQHTSRRE